MSQTLNNEENQSLIEEYLERIRADFIEPINSYKIISEGWTNLVIEINTRWIFRFIRNKNNFQLALERDFLPKFASISPVIIPHPVMSGDGYLAYRKIIGERFAPNRYLLFSPIQKTKLLKLLGEFLTCLHDFSFTHPYLSEAPYGGSDFWSDLWLLVKDHLSEATKDKAENYFIDVFKQISTIPVTKTLIHSDLGTNNILVNFEQSNLAGIIDFGDLCMGDPAADFAGFYRNFGRQFVEELLQYYQRSIESNFWARIEYESKRKMFFVVYFAWNYGFESHIPSILEYIEKLF